MALIPITAASIQLAMQNDCQQMRTMIGWLQQRNITYSQEMTTANMTTAGISAGDQTNILAFIADIARLVTFLGGSNPGVFANVSTDIANILGVV